MKEDICEKLRRILRAPFSREPAQEVVLAQITADLGYLLPEDYLDFMRMTNGYVGEVGEHEFVNVWPAEEVIPANKANQADECIPGLMLFGSNEGGEFYAFDMRYDKPTVVSIPSIPMETRYAVLVGNSFDDFLERLAEQSAGGGSGKRA